MHKLNPISLIFTTKETLWKLLILKITILDFIVKILKFGTPQTIAIIVLKIEKFDVTSL